MNPVEYKNLVTRIIEAWPPELRLLLRLASPSSTAGLKTQPTEVKDWEIFLQLVARHRLAPAIRSKLNSFEGIPAQIVEKIEKMFQQNRLVGLQRLREITQVHGDLQRRGIPSIALKGVLAGIEIHGDSVRRRAGDLDVLIDPQDFQAADRVLCESGFRPKTLNFSIGQSLLPWVLRQACDKEYFRPESQTVLELHWRLTRNPLLLAIDAKEAFAQARKVAVGNSFVQTLSFEHQLLFLCVHGAKHAWFRLFWLYDIAWLLVNEPIKMAAAEDSFRAQGLEQVFHQVLLLAHDLLGVSVSPELLQRAQENRCAVRLVRHALAEIADPLWCPETAPLTERLRRHHYALSLRRDFSYRVLHLRQAALSEQDWRELPLPPGFEWLYYVTRPVLWLRRRGKKSV